MKTLKRIIVQRINGEDIPYTYEVPEYESLADVQHDMLDYEIVAVINKNLHANIRAIEIQRLRSK